MKAVVCTGYGSPEVLEVREVARPVPEDHEILVRVLATTVTRGDTIMRSFRVPPLFWIPGRLALGITKPRHPILGMELAGDVEAVGEAVTRFRVGDAVLASTFASGFGGHAEYKCLPQDGIVVRKPANLSYEEAAGVAYGAITALWYLRDGGVGPGSRVLVNGASGAVGTYAVQLAHHYGADVTGVCSTGNVELVKALGADRVVDYTEEDFTQDGDLYDILFDAVGKCDFWRCLASLAPGGVFISTFMVRSRARWLSWRTGHRVIAGTAEERLEDLELLAGLLETGEVRPVIDRVLLLEQAGEAHAYVDTGHKKGNLVLMV